VIFWLLGTKSLAMKKPKKKPGDNAPTGPRSPYLRSRVSQGLDLLPSVDGRSMAARVFKDTYLAMVAHCGGEDGIPETLRLMCRRAAAIEAELINLEARFALARAEGEQPTQTDLDLYSRLVNTLRRVCEVLGWRRTARDVTPDPLAYARQVDADAEEVI
jgi:hypothetical protein